MADALVEETPAADDAFDEVLVLDVADPSGEAAVEDPAVSVAGAVEPAVSAALPPDPEEQPATRNAETAQALTARTNRREATTGRR